MTAGIAPCLGGTCSAGIGAPVTLRAAARMPFTAMDSPAPGTSGPGQPAPGPYTWENRRGALTTRRPMKPAPPVTRARERSSAPIDSPFTLLAIEVPPGCAGFASVCHPDLLTLSGRIRWPAWPGPPASGGGDPRAERAAPACAAAAAGPRGREATTVLRGQSRRLIPGILADAERPKAVIDRLTAVRSRRRARSQRSPPGSGDAARRGAAAVLPEKCTRHFVARPRGGVARRRAQRPAAALHPAGPRRYAR